MLFASFVARMGEERLARKVAFGDECRGKGYSGGQERDRMKDPEEDLNAVGIELLGWRKAAQMVGRWFRRVEEGAEGFMRKRNKTEEEATAERHRQGGRGGASGLLSRLTPGCGHHRHDASPRLK